MPTGPGQGDTEQRMLHASCVALSGRAVLILGRSGSGKSALALTLMAFGARLVADDSTVVSRTGDGLMAHAPASIAGRIEARGMGILHADPVARARLVLAVDLDRDETARLPQARTTSICDVALPLFHKVNHACFAPAILQYLRHVQPAE